MDDGVVVKKRKGWALFWLILAIFLAIVLIRVVDVKNIKAGKTSSTEEGIGLVYVSASAGIYDERYSDEPVMEFLDIYDIFCEVPLSETIDSKEFPFPIEYKAVSASNKRYLIEYTDSEGNFQSYWIDPLPSFSSPPPLSDLPLE